jgi:outer membrane protein
MKHFVFAVLALLLFVPMASAQRSFDLTANAVWLDPSGGGSFDDLSDPADIDIDADLGYGVAANIFFSDRISTEFAIARIEPETTITRRRAIGPAVPGGDLEIMPVTAVLQFHFAPQGFIDPYIGAGAAYVLYDFSSSQGFHNIDQIDFDDDVGLAVNAGIGIRLGQRLGLNVDAKYVPIESNATAVTIDPNGESAGRFDVSPIIISAGLSLRF